MSYEGFCQAICTNGHRFDFDVHDDDAKCDTCRGGPAWVNPVDDTNCDAYGMIVDFSSLIEKPEVTQTCDLGHVHVIDEETYRIPTDADRLQRYRWNGEKRIPLEDE